MAHDLSRLLDQEEHLRRIIEIEGGMVGQGWARLSTICCIGVRALLLGLSKLLYKNSLYLTLRISQIEGIRLIGSTWITATHEYFQSRPECLVIVSMS
jgi:hypothetical protein